MSRKHYRLSNGIVGRVTVVSLGQISEEMSKQMSWWHFERTGKHYRYQPGFHSKRPVTFPDGTKSGIDCCVVKIDNVIAPRFKCTATHPRTGLVLEVIESSASAAANKILDLLDVNTNKRWSGPEFFGFTKPDVARELMKDSEHFLPEHFNKRKKFMDDKMTSHQWNLSVKYPTPKDMLFASNLYAPTMLANETMIKLESSMVTSSSNHASPDRTETDDQRLNGLLLNGNGTLPLMLSTLNTSVNSPITTSSSPVTAEPRTEEALNVTWVELQSIGKPYHAQEQWWYYRHINGRYRIQPGYRALRCARNSANDEVFIHCEVLSKEGRPFYRCVCKNNVVLEDFNPTKVVQQLFKDLDIPVKKAWSGLEFFGFTQPAVLQQLAVSDHEEKLLDEKKLFVTNPLTPTYLSAANSISPSAGNSSLLEPFSQYLDSQAYRSIYNQNSNSLKNAFSSSGVPKLPSTCISTAIPGLAIPQLNGQFMQSMLSPDMLSPRFIQSLPNFISNNALTTTCSSNGMVNRSSFSRYMCVNMTECVRQLKLFINTLYSLQGEERLNVVQLQKLNTDMERLMLLLKNETSDLNLKIHAEKQKTLASPNGFIKLECDGDGRLVDQSVETDPTSGINLELEKLREVEVQCNSCQNPVTFCSGCGGRLALFVPGSSTATTTTTDAEPTAVQSPDTVSTSAETTTQSPKEGESSSKSPDCMGDKLSEHICKKIKLNNKGM